MKRHSFQSKRLALINWFESGPILILRYLLGTLGILGAVVLVTINFVSLPSYLVALALLFLSPLLFFLSLGIYVRFLHRHPDYRISNQQKESNITNRLDFAALAAIEQLSSDKSYANFWRSVTRDPLAAETLYRLGLSPEILSQIQSSKVSDQGVTALMTQTAANAEGEMAGVPDLVRAALTDPPVSQYLTEQQLTQADIDELIRYYSGRIKTEQIINDRPGGFAKDWAVSYTNLLDAVTVVISPAVQYRAARLPLYDRSGLLGQMVSALTSGQGRGVLLTGPAGVGKTELFYHLAAHIIGYRTKTELDGFSPRLLVIQRLLSLANTPAQLQQVIAALFAEVSRAGNVVLFIDQLNVLLTPGGSIGSVDLTTALIGVLQTSNVRIVATMDSESYLLLVKANPELNRLLTLIEVPPPADAAMPGIILSHLPRLETRYQVFFTYAAIKRLLALAGRYLKDAVSPLRELRAVERVASAIAEQGKTVVTADDVAAVIEQIAKVPIRVAATERQTLLDLKTQLHRRVVGQDFALQQVSDALLRARSGVGSQSGPIGSFLFLGPTGVGKTETAKALAEIYFGSSDRLIRLDLTEYADDQALQKLLGTSANDRPGELALAIQASPSAVVLLDEVEKAHPMVRNVLLQLVDEGRLTTNYGTLLDFTNTIVIATSNAGSDFIRAQILAGQSVDQFAATLTDQLISQKIFLTEFLNRFDGVAVFAPLTPAEIRQVVTLQVNALKHRLFKDKGLAVTITDPVLDQLAKRGYDPVFGARALQRVIQNELETAIAKQIITANPKPGSTITVDRL